MSDRNWKEAKPKWVVEDALAEMAGLRTKLALRWPTEAAPTASFGFGDYDRAWGTVRMGTFYVANHHIVTKVSLREKLDDEPGWKRIRFSVRDGKFTDNVQRGHYFDSEKDASLVALWKQCEAKAKELEQYWLMYEGASK